MSKRKGFDSDDDSEEEIVKEVTKKGKKKIEDEYIKMDPREHVLLRPDMYVSLPSFFPYFVGTLVLSLESLKRCGLGQVKIKKWSIKKFPLVSSMRIPNRCEYSYLIV